MKKYGLKDSQGWIFVVSSSHIEHQEWKDCVDPYDGKFGTDDINKAYQYAAKYPTRIPQPEVYEKASI